MGKQAVSFEGSVTTTGRSEAVRLEKAFFRAHPEFRQRARVRAQAVGEGHVLVSVTDPTAMEDQGVDPIVAAYLGFLETDMRLHPERLRPFTAVEMDAVLSLVRGVDVSDDDTLPDDVTF